MTKVRTFQGRPVREVERGGRTLRYVADQIVVRLRPKYRNDTRAQSEVLKSLPAECTLQSDGFDPLGMAVINVPGTADLFELAKKLKKREAVESAEPNYLDSAS